jgi:hypothetical protein
MLPARGGLAPALGHLSIRDKTRIHERVEVTQTKERQIGASRLWGILCELGEEVETGPQTDAGRKNKSL